jgi:hypothetical protein
MELRKVENQEIKATEGIWDLARLEQVIRDQKGNIALINGVPEITRPIALELFNQVRMQALASGLSIREKADVLYKDENSVIVEFRLSVYQAKDIEGNPIPAEKMPLLYEISEVGEAHREEKGKEFTFIRTAYTRAMKRALERLIGEDFINKVVLELIKPEPKKATESQKNYIKKLLAKKGISENKLPKPIDDLTMEEASKLIEKLKRIKAKQ